MSSQHVRLLLFAATAATVAAVQQPRILKELSLLHKNNLGAGLNSKSSTVPQSPVPIGGPLPMFIELPEGGDIRKYRIPSAYRHGTSGGTWTSDSIPKQSVDPAPLMRRMPKVPSTTKKQEAPGSDAAEPQPLKLAANDSLSRMHELVIHSQGEVQNAVSSLMHLVQAPPVAAAAAPLAVAPVAPVTAVAPVAAAAPLPPLVAAAPVAGVAPVAGAVPPAAAPVAGAVPLAAAPLPPDDGGGSSVFFLLGFLLLCGLVGGGVAVFLKWRAKQNGQSGRLGGIAADSQDSQFWKSAKSRQSHRKSQLQQNNTSDSEPEGKTSDGSKGDTPSGQSGTAKSSGASYRDRRGGGSSRGLSAGAADDAKGQDDENSGSGTAATAHPAAAGSYRSRRGGGEKSEAPAADAAPAAAETAPAPARGGSARSAGGRSRGAKSPAAAAAAQKTEDETAV